MKAREVRGVDNAPRLAAREAESERDSQEVAGERAHSVPRVAVEIRLARGARELKGRNPLFGDTIRRFDFGTFVASSDQSRVDFRQRKAGSCSDRGDRRSSRCELRMAQAVGRYPRGAPDDGERSRPAAPH
jgi:hypothetical protein